MEASHDDAIALQGRFHDLERHLPLPLASVAWAYVGARDSRERTDLLFGFLEVAVRLVGIIALSGLRFDRETFLRARPSLQGRGGSPSVRLRRATLGTWVSIDAGLAKSLRRLTDAERCELFHVRDAGRVAPLASRELGRLLDRTRARRNDWFGHDAVPSSAERERRLQDLAQIVTGFLSITSPVWDGWHLVRPRVSSYRSGIYHYSVDLLRSSRFPFREETAELTAPLDSTGLYLLEEGASRALQLVPFLRLLRTADGDRETCYFYDRIEDIHMRWLSYGPGDAGERYEAIDPELEGVIADLDEPQRASTNEDVPPYSEPSIFHDSE